MEVLRLPRDDPAFSISWCAALPATARGQSPGTGRPLDGQGRDLLRFPRRTTASSTYGRPPRCGPRRTAPRSRARELARGAGLALQTSDGAGGDGWRTHAPAGRDSIGPPRLSRISWTPGGSFRSFRPFEGSVADVPAARAVNRLFDLQTRCRSGASRGRRDAAKRWKRRYTASPDARLPQGGEIREDCVGTGRQNR